MKTTIRLGALVPAGNVIVKREFSRLCPAGLDVQVLEFSYPTADSNFCAGLVAAAQRPIAALRDWGADLIFLGCTAASMSCYADARLGELQHVAGVPVITAASAALQAATVLGAGSVAVATPYGPKSNQIIVDFLTSQQLAVAAIDGFGFDRTPELWADRVPTMPAQELLDFSLDVDRPQANALFLPCTAMGSLDVIHQFEARRGKPAFSSVQAGYWACLRRLGIDGRQSGAGQLLELWEF